MRIIPRRRLLLVLLQRGPRHGWGLADDLAAISGEPVERSGIYRTLRAMEEDRLVTSTWETSGRPTPKQRVYKLTPRGRRKAADARMDIERTADALVALLRR